MYFLIRLIPLINNTLKMGCEVKKLEKIFANNKKNIYLWLRKCDKGNTPTREIY